MNDTIQPGLFGETEAASPLSGHYAEVVFDRPLDHAYTYAVPLDQTCRGYVETLAAWPAVQDWVAGAMAEPEDLEELDVEF